MDYYLGEEIKIAFHRRRQHEIRRRFYIFLFQIHVDNFPHHTLFSHSLTSSLAAAPFSHHSLTQLMRSLSNLVCMLYILVHFGNLSKDIVLFHEAPLSGKILLAI